VAPLALAVAGGVLHFLGFVGFGVWPLELVSLACLWGALEAVHGRRLAAAAGLGFAFGWTAHAGGFVWLWRLVEVFLGGDQALGGALWLAHSVWFALGFAAQALLYAAVRRRGWPVAAAGVSSLLLVEWLQPALFPVHVGYVLVDRVALIQLAALGGPLLASALVGLTNAAALETWRWLRGARPPPAGTWAVVGLAAAFALGFGLWRIVRTERALAEAPGLRVGVVQANAGVLDKRRAPELVHRRHLEQTRELLAAGELDLVVWPETVLTRGIGRPLPVAGDLVRDDLRVPLLFGAATVQTVGGRRVKHNSALLIDADGTIRDAYDKNLLVPFAERVPFAALAGALAERLPNVQEFAAGSHAPPLRLGPWRISTPICSESAEPGHVRRMVAQARPHLLVTLSNDAWFGDSHEPWIHLQVTRLRAVEHGRSLVHATNSGVSAVVDPLGRIVARAGLLTRENLRAEVPLLDGGPTLYGRLGDWPGWLAGAALAGLLLARRRAAAALTEPRAGRSRRPRPPATPRA
jgi:apolipoprotein N-acyltransferase